MPDLSGLKNHPGLKAGDSFGRMTALAGGHLAVGGSLGAGQHNPRPLCQRLGRRVAPYPTLEGLAFAVAQLDGRCRSSSLSHDVP